MKKSVGPKKVVPYDHAKIEKKWQKYWLSKKIYKAADTTDKKKFYALIEFPYPSGDGLHVGHIRSNTAMDIISRKRRMEGYNVLYPIGWDAFGLPTENYAIKTGIQPEVVTKQNTDTFRRQLQELGFGFDWSREINTTSPEYYKWTQWIFLQFYKKGLAYKKKMAINWCPKDLIGLANEEVIDGKCERCGTPVEKREKEQWMLAITKYADRLDKDLDDVDFLERIKIQQRNWIGKSEGAQITFELHAGSSSKQIEVFTTRPDTIYGVTYVVLAPEHAYVKELIENKLIANSDEVIAYIANTKKETDIERTDATKEKTGVELKGIKAINPANKEEVPVWIADYVLADYGSGAVMAVPAHDERDSAFAQKYNLATKIVIEPKFIGTEGEGAVRSGLEYVKREAVCAIVRNPKDDTYLCINWKGHHMHGLVTGGIEANEDVVESARREVQEETGYKNLKHIKTSPYAINTYFYHRIKQQNRWAHFQFVFFDLENEERLPVQEKEAALHEVVWKKKSELTTFFSVFEGKFLISLLDSPEYVYTNDGLVVNSGTFNGKNSEDIKKDITESVGGKWITTYKLRDWVFSRQRYWGEPIPVVHCAKCGIVPVPEKDLPVKLPKVKNYKPTETGESPLAAISTWVTTKCPQCKGKATRETDTMPQWAGSSWYYLRYVDPKNKKAFADKKKLEYWTPVDWYNGGMEHTTLHLLYSRFWHKFLFDLGLVPTQEPYQKRTSHGLILAEGGEKMSKSKGNVINPDSIVQKVGADTLRMYEMFMGPFDQPIAWSTDNIAGVRRFIERVWKLREKVDVHPESDTAVQKIIHKAIKKVSDDIEAMRFNTAISTLMIALNDLEKAPSIDAQCYAQFVQLLAPFAPHVTEELWASLGNKKTIHVSEWPKYDPQLATDSDATIVVQINGKMRGSFTTSVDTSKDQLETQAKSLPEAAKWLEGKEIKKVIVVPNKLVNIVVA